MYIAPDAMLPIASAIAAVVGVVLTFWRRVIAAVRLLVRRGLRQ
jgi:hypothetical protein